MSAERILVIDDDPDVCDALRMMLEPCGYRVTCCPTGPEGVARLHAETPDLLLLDIMLASPTEGFHIAYELRRDEHLRDLPIIMISSIGKKLGLDYAREVGSDYLPVEDFLDKPLDAATVRGVVRQALDRRARAPAGVH
ncbi:MAG: response regulator [Phycisphaerae bacterium]|nr:MAG: response regulator [Planctomycetota bacterium]KAB2949150.1 MAG: response regulator [Phycisphaerae bacterium]MBE7456319.1 response regulator [Planctomycetia bacterium]MCK6465649.1 response regulator [Phycisphaerae bacterium]MCL4718438.1 response regulator [Phycisphaerae bacterium]